MNTDKKYSISKTGFIMTYIVMGVIFIIFFATLSIRAYMARNVNLYDIGCFALISFAISGVSGTAGGLLLSFAIKSYDDDVKKDKENLEE